MSRGLSSAVLSALSASTVRLVTFAKLSFDSGTMYVHDGLGTYTWGSQNWLGLGDFGGISTVEEGAEVSPYSLNLTLSGLDSSLISETLGENYYMREVDIYLGLLDGDDALIDTPTKIWSGFMDVMSLSAGASGGDSITLTAESEMSKFDRSANLRYTDTMLKKRNSSDKFFEFLKDIEGVKIMWGKKTATTGFSSPNLNPIRPSYMK